MLQKARRKEQTARAVVKAELANFRGSFSTSDQLEERFAESDKALGAAREEVVSLTIEVVHADTKKTDAEEKVAEDREEVKQRMVRLNVALVGRNPVEKLTRLLETEFVNAVDTVIQQLGHYAMNGVRQEIERSYLTVREPFPVALTGVSRFAPTSIRWMGEGS